MKTIMKKAVIYLMVGVMQIGLFATVAEASPLYNDNSQRVVQIDRHDRHDRHDNERRRNHDERLRRENERHEREMRRHHHESEREYREHQSRFIKM